MNKNNFGSKKSAMLYLLITISLSLSSCVDIGFKPEVLNGKLDFRSIIRQAKESVFPAVVFLKCLKETYAQGKKVVVEVSGSGVLISASGELLTNWHVTDKASEVRCLLYNGEAYTAKILGSDKDTDLSLVKLLVPEEQGKVVFPYAKIGDSSLLNSGDFVMAMGAPWGLSRSVSLGIVSCTRRFLPGNSEYSLWLQTDAAISPGNSGGPLINTRGEVVGINTRGVLFGGDMAFAIPSLTITDIVKQLRKFGRVNWSYTGLQLQPLKDFHKNIYFSSKKGVIVAGTDPDSPAQRAGLKPRDIILGINGENVTVLTEEDLPSLKRLLGNLPKLKVANLLVQRDGKNVNIELIPGEKGKVEGAEFDCPRWDFTVKSINRFANPALYFYQQQGVFIFGIRYPGNASQSGLQKQDIILKIGDKKISSLQQVKLLHRQALLQVEQKNRIVFTVLRNGLLRQAVLDFSRDFAKE